jgi:hypothetical protein
LLCHPRRRLKDCRLQRVSVPRELLAFRNQAFLHLACGGFLSLEFFIPPFAG